MNINKKIDSFFNFFPSVIKYTLILSFCFALFYLSYYFLDPHYQEAIDAFILRVIIYCKTSILLFIKFITKEFLTFFWGVVIMQFSYGFIIGGIKKFFLMSLSSKIILLCLSLGKRYLIDNVIMVGLNNNFLVHLKTPISNLLGHYKELFKEYSLKKKIAIWAAAIGIPLVIISPILYFVGLLTFILEKMFSANMWKAMLIWLLKILTVFLTFFSNIWDSWFAPILEIVLFTWILGLLEKIPFIGKLLKPIYKKINLTILKMKRFLRRHFHRKVQKGFSHAVNHINYHVDITILKSQNEQLIKRHKRIKQKAMKRYFHKTLKTQREYIYNKRINAYLKNEKTQDIRVFSPSNRKNK